MQNSIQIFLCGTPDMPIDFNMLCELGEIYGFSPDNVLFKLMEDGFCVTGTPLVFRAEKIESKAILTPNSPNWENTIESFLVRSWEYETRMANGCL